MNKRISSVHKDIQVNYEDFHDLKNTNQLIDTGYEYVELGQYDEALKLFSIGLSFNNSDPDILNGIGITFCEMGKLEKSRKVLERSVRFNPEDGITLANLAGVCWEMGELEKAIFYYNRSIKFSPEIEDVYFNLINLYIETGSLYVAYITCMDLLKQFPGNSEGKELLDEIILNLALSLY